MALLRHGRAMALPPSLQVSAAFVATWFLGSEAGNAIDEVVFGKVNPSGHPPVSFLLVSGQQPFHYRYLRTSRPDYPAVGRLFTARYRQATNGPLYPFGHGLSYASFDLRDLRRSAKELGIDQTLGVTAALKDTGRRAGARVVQLCLHDEVASMARPVRELKGFQRVALAPGAGRVVRLQLAGIDLGFTGASGKPVMEPGSLTLCVGDSSSGRVGGPLPAAGLSACRNCCLNPGMWSTPQNLDWQDDCRLPVPGCRSRCVSDDGGSVRR